MKDKINFDMESTIRALRVGKGLSVKDGIFTPLIKQLTEAAMQAELEEHLSTEESPSRKIGATSKTMKTPAGEFELKTPCDRANTFEPQIVKKHQMHLTDELKRKVIALFALGNSYQDIRTHIVDMYDISLSNGTINAVTDKLLPRYRLGVNVIWMRFTPSFGWMASIIKSRKTGAMSARLSIPS
jgi:transposase-like protein